MGVRLGEEEAWAELEHAHTGVLTTLRRDGRPASHPVWFATVDCKIDVRTPAKTRKVAHVRHDPRATFLVERGEKWIELCAVMVYADVELLDPGEEYDAASAAHGQVPGIRDGVQGHGRQEGAGCHEGALRGALGGAAPDPH
jgi:nitroimidazol reductase NimA-like FMN-containing flavoprotein (pyridoxamine 5'-phosphate oxidase superfamily)